MIHYTRDSPTFSVKDQIVNILSFLGHMVFVPTVVHSSYRQCADTHGCVPVKLDLPRQATGRGVLTLHYSIIYFSCPLFVDI